MRALHLIGPWALAVLVGLAAPLVFANGLGLSVLCQIGIAIIACQSFNLLLGEGGMLSFGHAAFTGTGAYAAIHLLRADAQNGLQIPVSLLPLAGGLAGLVFAAVVGLLLTRRAGTIFAMITLGLGELVYAAAQMFPQWSGGEAGASGNRVRGPALLGVDFASAQQVYYLIAAYALACALLLYGFTGTALGRLLNAVRDNPERVEFLGYDPRWVRYRALLVSGFMAGVAGGLAAVNFEIVTPEVFSPLRSGAYLLFTFLGGTGYFLGPVVGAVLMVLALVVLSGWTAAWLLYMGLAFMLAVGFAPTGLVGVVVAMRDTLRSEGLRSVASRWLVLFVSGGLALIGFAALVEMAYHRQLGAVLGTRFMFLGLGLDVANAWHWAAVLTWAAANALVWHLLLRHAGKPHRHARPLPRHTREGGNPAGGGVLPAGGRALDTRLRGYDGEGP